MCYNIVTMTTYELVRISPQFIPAIDELIENAKDEYGGKKFRSRRAVIDEAIKSFLEKTGKEAVAQ